MNIETLKSEIITAFQDVQLGDGIGLWEAQAIDDYESKEKRLLAKQKDERESWQAINHDELFTCGSSLSFFDSKGMLFYIPAFVLAELDDKTCSGPVYSLTQSAVVNPEKFCLFNGKQSEAIVKFLEWCILNEDYAFERAHIERALLEFWMEKQS